MEWKWNADAFDAIRITAPNGEFEIVGADSNEIVVEGETSARHLRAEPQVTGRWLLLSSLGGGSEWTLELPKHKAWVIELSAASGEVEIQDLHARFAIQLGSGQVQFENCRGAFHVRAGSGDVAFENCVQTDAPTIPEPAPEPARAEANGVPPTPGFPPIPPIPPPPPISKERKGKQIHIEIGGDWEEYGREWEAWGEHLGEQFSRWADKFSREFRGGFGCGGKAEERPDGMHMRLGSGDIQLEEVDAAIVTARLGSGDLQIQGGRVGELDVEASRGDIQIESTLPTTAWAVVTRHGDIQLVLPGDSFVRLDAATRHGEIECDAPLVRVGRPGREARHGGRMVGTIGEGLGEPVDLHLECLHGDIEIAIDRRASRYASPAAYATAPPRAVVPKEPVPPTAATQSGAPNAVVPVTVTDLPEPEAALTPPSEQRVQVYDSQLTILQALQAGEITVAEAEMLLHSLKN